MILFLKVQEQVNLIGSVTSLIVVTSGDKGVLTGKSTRELSEYG